MKQNSTSGYLPQKIESTDSEEIFASQCSSSIIHNCQKVETQMPVWKNG